MSILLADLRLYGSAVMALDDTTTAIGGAIDRSKRISFADVNGSVQIVSSAAGDTVPTVQMFYLDSAGALQNETKTLNGTTPVTYTGIPSEVLRGLKSGSTTGDIALEAQTATTTGTAQSGTANDITLAVGASAVDNAYIEFVIRLTGGTGSGQIRRGIQYVGATKVLTVDHAWTTPPDGTTTYRIATGLVFEKLPNEVLDVRRPFYNAAADTPSGSSRTYYEKCFWENNHATLSLLSGQCIEQADPLATITFGVEATLNAAGTNGGGNNRQVAPAGITFDSATKSIVGGGTLAAASRQGIWFAMTRAAGAVAVNSTFTTRLQGYSA